MTGQKATPVRLSTLPKPLEKERGREEGKERVNGKYIHHRINIKGEEAQDKEQLSKLYQFKVIVGLQ